MQGCAAHAAGARRRTTLAALCLTPTLAAFTARTSHATAATARNEFDTVLDAPGWPAEFPFTDDQFARYDESKDTRALLLPLLLYKTTDRSINIPWVKLLKLLKCVVSQGLLPCCISGITTMLYPRDYYYVVSQGLLLCCIPGIYSTQIWGQEPQKHFVATPQTHCHKHTAEH